MWPRLVAENDGCAVLASIRLMQSDDPRASIHQPMLMGDSSMVIVSGRVRSGRVLLTLIIAVVLVITSCSSLPQDPDDSPESDAGGETVQVEADGFVAGKNVDNTVFSISGGPGVAVPGIDVEVEYHTGSVPEIANGALDSYLNWSPGAVSLSLADGSQPQQPVTITIASAIPESFSEVDLNNLIAFRQSDDGSVTALPVEYASLGGGNAQFTVVTDHFSSIVIAGVDIGKWFEEAWKGVQSWFNVGGKPDCFGDEVTISGVKYTAGGAVLVDSSGTITNRPSETMYPCIVDKNGSAGVTLHSADNISWAVRSEPPARSSKIGELDMESNIADDVSRFLLGEDFLMPGGDARAHIR